MKRYERSALKPMTDFDTYPDAMPTIWNSIGWSQSTSSAAFLEGERWGDWDGAMVVGIMELAPGGGDADRSAHRRDPIQRSNEDVPDVTELTLPMEPGRFRSVVLGPDGSLYTAVDESAIH